MNLSASSVNTYEQCHLRWYFTYIEARKEPYDEARVTGLEVHDFAEAILRYGAPIPNGGPCDVCKMVPHSPQCPNTSDADPLVDVFIEDIYPTYGEPVLIEAGFELDVEGVTYTGFIDSVDQKENGALPGVHNILRDLKTTKSRPRKGKYRDALVGYWLGARELGYEPHTIMLDYIVRTKTPYYWPEEQPTPDQDEIDRWTGQVLRVAASIEMGDWEPTGLGRACSWCPWKDICGPYERWSYMTSPIREEARDANR